MNTLSSVITNVSFQKIIQQIAVYVHEQAMEIRKEYDIPESELRIYSDYAIYATDNNDYYAFHYVVHVDSETEKFFIVSWTPATEDEYLDSLNY
jgi:hypothetical protein